jgi:hypothetical protein
MGNLDDFIEEYTIRIHRQTSVEDGGRLTSISFKPDIK